MKTRLTEPADLVEITEWGLETRQKPQHTSPCPARFQHGAQNAKAGISNDPVTTRKRLTIMAADKQNLQDAFLNHVRKAKVPVTIFLINGVKLQGVITWFARTPTRPDPVTSVAST